MSESFDPSKMSDRLRKELKAATKSVRQWPGWMSALDGRPRPKYTPEQYREHTHEMLEEYYKFIHLLPSEVAHKLLRMEDERNQMLKWFNCED